MEKVTYFNLIGTLIFALFLFVLPLIFKNKTINSELVTIERYPYLDALRGIVATMVFIHHSTMIYNFHHYGEYTSSGVLSYSSESLQYFYTHFGQSSVMIFFMITGFLFFDKMIHSKGNLDSFTFYKKRIKRLLPAMVSCAIIAAIVSSLITNSLPNISFKTIITWLSFGFFRPESFGQLPGSLMVSGVFWTLVFEIKFYLLVPSLSLITRDKTKSLLYILLISLVLYYCYYYDLFDRKTFVLIMCFIAGMISATLNQLYLKKEKSLLKSPITAVIVCFIVLYFSYKESSSYNINTLIPLFFLFFIIISGNSILGVLKISPFKLAGKCSYSIYIMHGLALNFVMGYLFIGLSYSYVVIISALFMMVLSTINYFLVERPFLYK